MWKLRISPMILNHDSFETPFNIFKRLDALEYDL
tara:strand:+ start:340 stop:441 length:102 start_codon:yes stop_codon:yes gene_type:complete